MKLDNKQKAALLAFTHKIQTGLLAEDADEALPGTRLDDRDVLVLLDLADRCLAKADDEAPAWLIHLYQAVMAPFTKDTTPTRERLLRFQDCLMSIPDYGQYALLLREYGCANPGSRPGRDPNEAATFANKTCLDPDSTVQMAVKFLQRHSRVEYVLTGKSDLDDHFDADTKAMLKSAQVHVMADLGLIVRICAVRAHRA